jgi:hypothetical protein
VALAERVAAWSVAPPERMEGLAWFRLPVAGERDTWPSAAFDAVLGGRAPRASGRAEALASSDAVGTWDVRVVATGEDELVDPCVRATWTGGRALATDGIGAAVSGEAGRAQWALAGTVRPGDAPRTLGWIRLAPGERIDAVDLVAGGGCAGDADARVGVRAGHDGRGDGERIAGR